MSLNEAIAMCEANGYRVSKSRARTTERPRLNALGLPISPLFDPKWKRKTPLTSIARLLKPMPASTPWVK